MRSVVNFKKIGKILLAGVIFNFLGILLYYLSPYFTGYLIDDIVLKDRLDLLPQWIGLVAVFAVILHCYLFYFLKFCWDKYGLLVSNEVRNRLKEQLLRVPSYEYEKFTRSLIYNLFMGDASMIGSVTLNYVASSIVSVLRVAACLIILWLICPPLTLLSALFIPLYSCAMLLNRRRLQQANAAERDALDNLIFFVNKLIDGKTQINLFRQEAYFDAKFTQRMGQWTAKKLRYLFWLNMTKEVPNFLTTLAPFAVLAYGAVLVNHGQLTIGRLVMFSQYVAMIFEPLNLLSYVMVEKKSSRPIFDRVKSFLFGHEKKAGLPYSARGESAVFIRNYTVLNKNRAPLFVIPHLELKRQGLYILSGDNGAGKSTFLNLLSSVNDPALLQADEGAQLYLDPMFRAEISYLYQPGFIFEGTLEENITFGQPKSELFAELVHILGIPETGKEITFNPLNLSLGEQQKLHLARVFFQNQSLIFLDEPSTNLDADSRRRLREHIGRLKTDKLFVIITHDEDFQSMADGFLEIKEGSLRQYEAEHPEKISTG